MRDAEAGVKQQVMSERKLVQQVLTDFISTSGKFTAPYGIVEGLETAPNGRKVRSITFGVARISDIHVRIYSPHYLAVNDSRYGWTRCESVQDTINLLKKNYSLS